MTRNSAFVLGLVMGVCMAVPAMADWYDSFFDGDWYLDANYSDGDKSKLPNFDANDSWHIDDPQWWFYELAGEIFYETIENGAIRLRVESPALPFLFFLAAYIDDGDHDPNTSATYWDDTTNHYLLSLFIYPVNAAPDPNDYDDPNWDAGAASLMMHADTAVWTDYNLKLDLDNKAPGGAGGPNTPWAPGPYYFHFVSIKSGIGTDFVEMDRIKLWENDPNWTDMDQWEREGIWMLMQYQSNGVTGDPNGKWMRAAVWPGGKYDWDGTYLLEAELSGTWYDDEVDRMEWYQPGGVSLVCAMSEDWTSGGPADAAYDDVEARTGIFTNLSRALTIKVKDCCELHVDPDLLDDPNHDPNDLNELRRYTHGTGIVLHSVVPCGNKAFKKWTIKGPNDSGDPLYQVVTDTNEVVYLTMDGDYLVKATCKCGGGIEPFAGVVLLVLGLSVAVRRLT